VLALARRIRWSICAPHVGLSGGAVSATMVHHPAFRKKCPRFDWAPPGVGFCEHQRPRGSAFGGPPNLVSPNAGCLYPRVKTGESLSDARLMANNFYVAQLRFFGPPMVMAQKSGATIWALMSTRPKQNPTRRGTSPI